MRGSPCRVNLPAHHPAQRPLLSLPPPQLYQEVCGWPAPLAGPLLQLQAGLTTLTARLPSWLTLPHPSTALDPEVWQGKPCTPCTSCAPYAPCTPCAPRTHAPWHAPMHPLHPMCPVLPMRLHKLRHSLPCHQPPSACSSTLSFSRTHTQHPMCRALIPPHSPSPSPSPPTHTALHVQDQQ